MAIIVEDGTRVPNANSYATIAQADSYFGSVSNAAWLALTLAAKEAALVLGCQFIDNQQIYPYNGTRQTFTQNRQWPRTGAAYWATAPAVPESVIPSDVVLANIIAAGASAAGLLPASVAGGQEVKREKVDVIEIEYFHSNQGKLPDSSEVVGGNILASKGYSPVTGLLLPFLKDSILTRGTSVSRAQASRRGPWYIPAVKPPSFARGAFDAAPLAEDASLTGRTP
jgi:hypothetical protein